MKGVAFATVLLLVGLASAPNINANISKEYVEATTGFCSINGVKAHTIKLIQNEAEVLFDDIKEIESQKLISRKTIADNSYSGSSFHGNTSINNSNWYVIKLWSPDDFHLEEVFVKWNFRSPTKREDIMGFLFTNLQGENYDYRLSKAFFDPNDKFFHLSIGKINYTNDQLYYWEEGGVVGELLWYEINITFSPGFWYLICYAADTIEGNIETWINATENYIEFVGTTEGRGSFIFGTYKFLGNLNIWNKKVSIICNGKKRLQVNNTLIGFFRMWPGHGLLRFQGIDPNGDKKTAMFWQPPFEYYNTKVLWSDFDVIWTRQLIIIGEEGTWSFEIDAFLYTDYPSVDLMNCFFFWGADIKLP